MLLGQRMELVMEILGQSHSTFWARGMSFGGGQMVLLSFLCFGGCDGEFKVQASFLELWGS